jgi:hypothetical protein
MLEAIFGVVFPMLKEVLWAACGAMMAYALNKFVNQFV